MPEGFAIGTVVYSKISFSNANGSIEPGSRGVVKGPSIDSDVARINVAFDTLSSLNVLLSNLSKTPDIVMPEGFAIGTVVYSKISFSTANGSIEPGSRGVVMGPAISSDVARINVDFDTLSNIDVQLTQLSKTPIVMPEGFAVGTVVYSKINHSTANGSIEPGSRGVVKGPAIDLDVAWINVDFDTFSNVNVLLTQLSKAPTMKGEDVGFGLRRGDRVVALRYDNNKLQPGDHGMVVGTSTSALSDSAERVQMSFPNWPSVNMLFDTVVALAVWESGEDVGGGFKRGDRVVYTSHSGDKLNMGDVGTVVGPSTAQNSGAAGRVKVSFPNWNMVNILCSRVVAKATWESGTDVGGGLRRGDRVVTLRYENDKLKPGDHGIVVGPSTSDLSDAAERVLMSFPNWSSVNILFDTVIAVAIWESGEDVGCGLRRGDRVVTLRYENDKLQPGDHGMVVGPSKATLSDSAERVLMSFPNWSKVNMLFDTVVALAVWESGEDVGGGFKRGDRVVSTFSSDDKLNVGDVGTVVGPSTAQNSGLAKCVLVSFPNWNVFDVLCSRVVVKATWESGTDVGGGLRRGDRLVSLIHMSGGAKSDESLNRGELGTVVGPSTTKRTDAAKWVLMYFPNFSAVDMHCGDMVTHGAWKEEQPAAHPMVDRFDVDELVQFTELKLGNAFRKLSIGKVVDIEPNEDQCDEECTVEALGTGASFCFQASELRYHQLKTDGSMWMHNNKFVAATDWNARLDLIVSLQRFSTLTDVGSSHTERTKALAAATELVEQKSTAILAATEATKLVGNKIFGKKQYSAAKKKYSQGILGMCDGDGNRYDSVDTAWQPLLTAASRAQLMQLHATLLTNRAFCSMKAGCRDLPAAIMDARAALGVAQPGSDIAKKAEYRLRTAESLKSKEEEQRCALMGYREGSCVVALWSQQVDSKFKVTFGDVGHVQVSPMAVRTKDIHNPEYVSVVFRDGMVMNEIRIGYDIVSKTVWDTMVASVREGNVNVPHRCIDGAYHGEEVAFELCTYVINDAATDRSSRQKISWTLINTLLDIIHGAFGWNCKSSTPWAMTKLTVLVDHQIAVLVQATSHFGIFSHCITGAILGKGSIDIDFGESFGVRPIDAFDTLQLVGTGHHPASVWKRDGASLDTMDLHSVVDLAEAALRFDWRLGKLCPCSHCEHLVRIRPLPIYTDVYDVLSSLLDSNTALRTLESQQVLGCLCNKLADFWNFAHDYERVVIYCQKAKGCLSAQHHGRLLANALERLAEAHTVLGDVPAARAAYVELSSIDASKGSRQVLKGLKAQSKKLQKAEEQRKIEAKRDLKKERLKSKVAREESTRRPELSKVATAKKSSPQNERRATEEDAKRGRGCRTDSAQNDAASGGKLGTIPSAVGEIPAPPDTPKALDDNTVCIDEPVLAWDADEPAGMLDGAAMALHEPEPEHACDTVDPASLSQSEHIELLISQLEKGIMQNTETADSMENTEGWNREIVPIHVAQHATQSSVQPSAVTNVIDKQTNTDEEMFNFDQLPFEFEIKKEAVKQLKRLDAFTRKAYLRRMYDAGSGNQSGRLWHHLKGGDLANIPSSELDLYSTGFLKGWRVLWELAPSYSTTKEKYVDTIRIWSITPHDQYERHIKDVVRCYKEGLTCIPEMRKRLKRQGAVVRTTDAVRKPSLYEVVLDGHQDAVRAADRNDHRPAATTTPSDTGTHCPPAQMADDSRTLVKFIEMNTDFCDKAMKGLLTDKMAFKTNQREHEIVMNSIDGKRALLLIGRSGTGKTTIAMHRMSVLWQLFQAENKRTEATQLTKRREWHGVFVTANGVLVSEVRDVFRERQLGSSGGHQQMLPEKGILPASLNEADVTDGVFPMFISAHDWLNLLDATLVDPKLPQLIQARDTAREALRCAVDERQCGDEANETALRAHEQTCIEQVQATEEAVAVAAQPFIERDANGLPICSKQGMLHQLGGLASLDAFRTSTKLPGAHDDEPDVAETQTPMRREVDADMFDNMFWKKERISERYRAVYSPSAVWMEIISYIKGRVESLRTAEGHLSKVEYLALGAKLGQFGKDETKSTVATRDEVYEIFLVYESWKISQNCYDRMDVVHNVHRRLLDLRYHGAPIHSMSIDEVQDFTQVGPLESVLL
jgi:hypothetical protein